MRQDTVLDLGLCFCNGFVRLGSLLHVVYPGPERVVTLRRADL